MSYLPKNRIIPNLYANPQQLIYKKNNKEYTGFYYKTYDGKFFTGKTPEDKPNEELDVYPKHENLDLTKRISKLAIIDAPTPFFELGNKEYNENLIINYNKLKGIKNNDLMEKFLPTEFYPTPTIEEIKFGEFNRFFCIKRNEIKYKEISKDTYDNLLQENPKWGWELYKPFSIKWKLKGTLEEIYTFNKSSVEIIEQKLKLSNFKEYINKEYTKYVI